MEKCLDFASTSTPTIFAYLQNKSDTSKLFVYFEYHGPKKVVFKRSSEDDVVLKIIVRELNQHLDISFQGIKYSNVPDDDLATVAIEDAKPLILQVQSDIPFMKYPRLPPDISELPLNECCIKCLQCENVLAEPHPNFFVVEAQADEIMENAMGCCRCCSTSPDDHLCGHIRSPETDKIFIDDGLALVTEDYLKKDSFIRIGKTPLIICAKCHQNSDDNVYEYFGFEKYPSKHIEILPMQADFVDKNGISLLQNAYKCWGAYFASRFMASGLDSYVLVTDGLGIPKFQLGFFFRRLLWFGNGETQNSLRNATTLCFFFTDDNLIIQKNITAKIRYPCKIMMAFESYLTQSHQLLKQFTPGYGEWKSAFFCLDCGNSCLFAPKNNALLQ